MLQSPQGDKSQLVRVVDVVALGPFMVWAGYQARELPTWARVALVLAGGATVAYNGINLAAVHERRRRMARR